MKTAAKVITGALVALVLGVGASGCGSADASQAKSGGITQAQALTRAQALDYRREWKAVMSPAKFREYVRKGWMSNPTFTRTACGWRLSWKGLPYPMVVCG